MKNSVFGAMPDNVIASSYGISRDDATELKSNSAFAPRYHQTSNAGFKRGNVHPQELVDHFAELDRLTGRLSLVETPTEPVPLAVVSPGVIIISDDEDSGDRSVRPSQGSEVASRTRSNTKK
ncbi:hypothetical protein EJB05_34463, partial [Eragrostis curvula]